MVHRATTFSFWNTVVHAMEQLLSHFFHKRVSKVLHFFFFFFDLKSGDLLKEIKNRLSPVPRWG
jgi:hypothetical protein